MPQSPGSRIRATEIAATEVARTVSTCATSIIELSPSHALTHDGPRCAPSWLRR